MFQRQIANKANFQMTQWQAAILENMQPFQGQYHTLGSAKRNWKTSKVGGNDQNSTDNLQKLIQKEYATN